VDQIEVADTKNGSYVINDAIQDNQDPEKEIAEIKKTMHLQNFQKMIHIAETDLQELHANN